MKELILAKVDKHSEAGEKAFASASEYTLSMGYRGGCRYQIASTICSRYWKGILSHGADCVIEVKEDG